MPGYSKWHNLYLERLLSDLSEALNGIFFKTASEAVLGAIRLCSAVSRKKGIIRCGYIGWYDLQISNSAKWHEPLNSPLRKQIRYLTDENSGIRSSNMNEPIFNWITFDINELEELLRNHGKEISSMIIDAYQIFFSSEKIIKKAIEICHNYDVLVVLDETKTGGRICKHGLGLSNNYDMDLVIFGKALANGAPISLIIGNEKILKFSELVRITGTFSKEMLSVYHALATLEFMEENSGFNKISYIGNEIVKNFNDCIKKLSLDSYIKVLTVFNSSLFDVSFSNDFITKNDLRIGLIESLIEFNILLLQGHPSFICYDHYFLDWEDLNSKIIMGLEKWKESL